MAIKKYLKILFIRWKFGMMREMAYPTSFLFTIPVEIGYKSLSLLTMQILFSNIKNLAGWSFYEFLFMYGINCMMTEFFLSTVVINLRKLPKK